MSYDPNYLPPTTQIPHQQPHGQPYPPVVSGPPQQYGPPVGYPPAPYGLPPAPPPKKWGAGKIVLVVFASISAFCLGAAVLGSFTDPDETETSSAPDAAAAKPTKGKVKPKPKKVSKFDMKVGTTLTRTDGDDVQEFTLTSFQYRESCGGAMPENGGYLVVEIKTVQRAGTGSINPLYFDFVSDEGASENSFSGMFSGCDPNDLDSTNSLRAGQKRSGQVVFDVASPEGSIELTPGLGADTIGSWRLK
jgi:hypothetical protein